MLATFALLVTICYANDPMPCTVHRVKDYEFSQWDKCYRDKANGDAKHWPELPKNPTSPQAPIYKSVCRII